ncbi:hypothetical protein MMC08_005572 [Hypocenomyce scalaris]|nr:hypothetical protein [Hypocenomyce scalaris]
MLLTTSLLLGLLPTIFGVTGEVLVKRAVPFGTPRSESHRLAKRTPLTWASAISKGACFIGQFTSGGPQSTYTDYSSLTTYGWIEDDDGGVNTPQADLADAFKGLDLSSAAPPNQFGKNLSMLQDGDFPTGSNTIGFGTSGNYQELYNTKEGVIVAEQNFSPAYYTGGNPATPLPALQRWSDVVYLVYANLCSKNNANPNGIKYFFRWHINDATSTQPIINQAVGITVAGGANGADQLKPWPGTKFTMDTDQGKALLGTPHGYGIAYFLIQHQGAQQLGMKTVDYITIFQTTYLGKNFYNMLVAVKDV